ncbi:hypothetical protein WSM22_23330 [Cytophagales bacterium WSM2-2]|nr:hypothetical protein WSM22_23330 [Cytophagales bacterium WSM2-2]
MKWLAFLLLLTGNFAFSQPGVDSLKSKLKNEKITGRERIDVLNELAYRTRKSDQKNSRATAEEALQKAVDLNYQKGEGIARLTICDLHYARAEYGKSLENAMTALLIFEKLNDKKGLVDSNSWLGTIYYSLKDREKSKEYQNKSLALAIEINYEEAIARAYNNFANLVPLGTDNRTVLDYYLKSLSYLKSRDDSHLKIILLTNLAGLYLTTDDTVKAYPVLKQALKLCEHQKNKAGLAYVHRNLGYYYSIIGQPVKAEKSLLECLRMATEIGDRKTLLDVYINLMGHYSERGNGAESHYYQVKYYQVRDSILNADKVQQVAELEARYELEKKVQTIHLLQQEKKNAAMWRYALVGGVAITVASAFIIFLLQRSRTRKARQLLEVQQLVNGKLQELDRLRSQFFTSISHEFRTPLTLILAPLEEVFKKSAMSEDQKVPLLIIKRNANRLLELINQLMDLSKLGAGKMELRVREARMQSFLQIISTSFDSLAEHKGITFVKSIQLEDQLFWYDHDKVEKIVTNLLSNAFKFTPANGKISITADVKSEGAKRFISVRISDTGIGIGEEEQKLVFSPFFQSSQVAERHTGTGIGLSLVKELVNLHNGSIDLESKIGEGTVFSILLPVDKSAFRPEQIRENKLTDPVPAVSSVDGKSYDEELSDITIDQTGEKDTVLIVEDNAELKNFIASVIHENFSVLTASDGLEAMETAFQKVPNLVLSDLMMPKLDGIALTEKLKADERTSHIPVILITAKNEPVARLDGLKSGADDFITKPFSTEELVVRITNLIEQRKKLALKFRERIFDSAATGSENSLEDRFLKKCRSIVDTHLSDFSFSVEIMADEINLSRTQLFRKTKALTGLSPNEFIKDLRLKKAEELIRLRTDSISQIGYSVGFSDQSYFTKCFKKQFGITPSDYATKFGSQPVVTER